LALLDVNEAFDPLFMEPITVIRRTETINQRGRVVISEAAFSCEAVVMPASPTDLQRLPEVEWTNKAISVYSITRLQGDTLTTKPDEILWHGSHYVVNSLEDYSHWGAGFCHVIATSMDARDPAPYPMGTA